MRRGAGEVGVLACGGVVVLVELFVDDVEREDGVDDPDAGGEVGSAVVDVGVAAGAGAVAQLGRDVQLERPAAGAGGEGVELGVELVGLAAEDRRGLPLAGGGEVGAGVFDLLAAVQERAVVDADGVGVLVFDDGAVHEGAEVADGAVVQVGGGDAARDRRGQLWGDGVHVGELVGHRDGDLSAGGAVGDALADRVGQRELAAQVVGLAGGDAEVGADGGDAVVVGEAGARVPAVSELFLLVGERQVLALVLLGLDAADLVRVRRVVEQQDDQAADRCEAFVAVAAGELVAGLGGEQSPLAGVEDDERLGGVGAVADAGHELAGAAEHAGEALDAVAGDLATLVGCKLEVLERDALDRAVGARRGDGGDVEQRGLGS